MLKKMIAISLLAMMAGTVHAQTITFDDKVASTSTLVENGYNGFNWSNFYILNSTNASYSGSSYAVGAISGTNVAYNGWGDDATISSNNAFVLSSAYLTDAWSNTTLTVTGYNNGASVWSQTFALNTTSPTLVSFNTTPVTSVTFSNQGTHFAMDNLTIAAVPEPETYALMGVGLLGLLAARRKKSLNTNEA